LVWCTARPSLHLRVIKPDTHSESLGDGAHLQLRRDAKCREFTESLPTGYWATTGSGVPALFVAAIPPNPQIALLDALWRHARPVVPDDHLRRGRKTTTREADLHLLGVGVPGVGHQ